jgi:hypothetical protein
LVSICHGRRDLPGAFRGFRYLRHLSPSISSSVS